MYFNYLIIDNLSYFNKITPLQFYWLDTQKINHLTLCYELFHNNDSGKDKFCLFLKDSTS